MNITTFARINEIVNAVSAIFRRDGADLIDDPAKIGAAMCLVGGRVQNASDAEVKDALREFCRINQKFPKAKNGGERTAQSEPPRPMPPHSESVVGETVCALLLENPARSNGEIAQITRGKVTGAKTTAAAVACYRTALVAVGKLPASNFTRPAVGMMICELLLKNSTRKNDDIAAEVRRRLGSRTTGRNISNYRNYLGCAGYNLSTSQ